jgi:O-methyltransferase involved in polyketide biosynthesis
MVASGGSATPLWLLLVSSTAATLLLAPSGCQANGGADDAIYARLGVKPPQNRFRVLKLLGREFPLSRWSWTLHGNLLPLLHLFDGERKTDRPKDVFVNLRVLWCKLLSSLDPKSLAYEGSNTSGENFTTYRLLPPYSIKWPLRYMGLWRFFPRWMHANIELRTVYLEGALQKVLGDHGNAEPKSNICVIILGGGYDSRGAKLSTRSDVQRVYELDLPIVVDSKRRMLQRAGVRLLDDDSNDSGARSSVCLEGVDLNDDVQVDRVLDKIRDELVSLLPQTSGEDPRWHVVVISEAVLMYLDTSKAELILEGLANRFCANNNNFTDASFIFADRLIRRVAGASRSNSRITDDSELVEVQKWLQERGWKLHELLFKPGATRNLGFATSG